jgi:hypothetical protein
MKVAFVILSSIALLMLQPQGGVQPPLVDHHQHLYSVETTRSSRIEPLDAADLIACLDAAGIRRAAVLSVAYQFGNPNRPVIDEYGQVRAEKRLDQPADRTLSRPAAGTLWSQSAKRLRSPRTGSVRR